MCKIEYSVVCQLCFPRVESSRNATIIQLLFSIHSVIFFEDSAKEQSLGTWEREPPSFGKQGVNVNIKRNNYLINEKVKEEESQREAIKGRNDVQFSSIARTYPKFVYVCA